MEEEDDVHTLIWQRDIKGLERLLSEQPEHIHLVDDSNFGDGFTPIHYAAYRGFYHGLKLLLDRGANPNVTTHANCTPLFYAAQQGHKDCVELLLKRM